MTISNFIAHLAAAGTKFGTVIVTFLNQIDFS